MRTSRKGIAGDGRLSVDFPKANEILAGEHYTFRIQAVGEGVVEISIDGGEWLPCRPAVGYWWYDWACQPGKHAVEARLVLGSNSEGTTPSRKFKVSN